MRRGRALSEDTSILNAFFIAGGGPTLPGLEQCAWAAAFPRVSGCFTQGYTGAWQLEAQLTAALVPRAGRAAGILES